MTPSAEENSDREDEDMKLLQSHAAQLSEHFDSVQIITTRHGHDGTTIVNLGEGNWFARYGSVKEWIAKEEERMRQGVRNE